MSETKFTKGKWVKTGQFTLSIGGDESYITTQQTGGYHSYVEEREANAHLIATAPEMYALLEEVINDAAGYGARSGKKVTWKANADKLLAKARGEQVDKQ